MFRSQFLVSLACFAVICHAAAPIAPHVFVEVAKNSEVVISLPGYDTDGDKLTAYITSAPAVGKLYQLSQVFSDYGYNPKRGRMLSDFTSPVKVEGSQNRIVYTPPANTNPPIGQWATFTYVIKDSTGTSQPGIIWLVPPHRQVVSSDFATNLDGWTVVNNGARAKAQPAGGLMYEPYSRGLLNHYIMATDAEINVDRKNNDKDLWYFQAPSKFLGNHAIAYGGEMVFTFGSAAGDFTPSKLNPLARVVVLECDSCNSGTGVRLVMPAGKHVELNGKTQQFRLPLKESEWREDPKNTLITLDRWGTPTQCEMVEVLSGLTRVQVLGDHTQWYESVALDGVSFVAGSGVPIRCASIYY